MADEPTLRFAVIRGEEYVSVNDLADQLEEQQFPRLAAWLRCATGARVVRKEQLRVVR